MITAHLGDDDADDTEGGGASVGGFGGQTHGRTDGRTDGQWAGVVNRGRMVIQSSSLAFIPTVTSKLESSDGVLPGRRPDAEITLKILS